MECNSCLLFYKGLNRPIDFHLFEITINEAFKKPDSLITIQKTEGKKKLETMMENLEQTIKALANTFTQLSKKFAEKLDIQEKEGNIEEKTVAV